MRIRSRIITHSASTISLTPLPATRVSKAIWNASSIKNSNFVSDIDVFESIGSGTQTGGPQVSSGHTRAGRWRPTLGRLNYTLANRYLFTVTGREDGSSRFGADHQWGFFPSAALGWRVSDEPFMAKMSAVELLKFRASYGLAGNPSIRPYQSMAHLLSQQYTFNGTVVPGYYPASVGNPNLGWEATKQLDIGADLGLFAGRVSLTADMYQKKTNDLLLAVNLPFESGFGSALQNAGSVSNNGYELGLTLTILDGKGKVPVGWTSTVNYSRNRNKVLDLGGGVQQIFANSVNSDLKLLGTLIQVGQPLGVFYGYQAAGLLRDSASAAAYTTAVKPLTGTSWKPGDVKLLDLHGAPDSLGRPTGPDGKIDANDRTIIGDPNPKYNMGFMNTFSFRAFRLSGDDGRRPGQQDSEPEQRASRSGQPGDEHHRRSLHRRLDGDESQRQVSAHQLHAGHDRLRHHERPPRGRFVRPSSQRHARRRAP